MQEKRGTLPETSSLAATASRKSGGRHEEEPSADALCQEENVVDDTSVKTTQSKSSEFSGGAASMSLSAVSWMAFGPVVAVTCHWVWCGVEGGVGGKLAAEGALTTKTHN